MIILAVRFIPMINFYVDKTRRVENRAVKLHVTSCAKSAKEPILQNVSRRLLQKGPIIIRRCVSTRCKVPKLSYIFYTPERTIYCIALAVPTRNALYLSSMIKWSAQNVDICYFLVCNSSKTDCDSCIIRILSERTLNNFSNLLD